MGVITMTPDQRQRAQERAAANRRSRAPGNRSDCVELIANLRSAAPKLYQPLIDRFEQGSKPAAAKLHCLQCVGWLRKEVSMCSSKMCPMWPGRPYQGANDDDEQAISE